MYIPKKKKIIINIDKKTPIRTISKINGNTNNLF